jgi:hypothetical protein
MKGLLSCLKMLAQDAPLALLGKTYLLASYQLPVQLAKLRFYLHYPFPDKQYQDFLAFWMGETALCRVKMALAHPADTSEMPVAAANKSYRFAEMPDGALYGFYPEEHHGDERFRWTRSLAAMRLDLPAGEYRITLSLLPVRKLLPDDDLGIFLNDKLIDNVTYSPADDSLQITVNQSHFNDGENWLYLVCRPWRIVQRLGHDERELGLPLAGLQVTTD